MEEQYKKQRWTYNGTSHEKWPKDIRKIYSSVVLNLLDMLESVADEEFDSLNIEVSKKVNGEKKDIGSIRYNRTSKEGFPLEVSYNETMAKNQKRNRSDDYLFRLDLENLLSGKREKVMRFVLAEKEDLVEKISQIMPSEISYYKAEKVIARSTIQHFRTMPSNMRINTLKDVYNRLLKVRENA